MHLGLTAVWWGSECLKGETRQLFGIPFSNDKLETDIIEYERVVFFVVVLFFSSLIRKKDFPLYF